MTLRLIIEHAPHPQRSVERLLEAGDLSIGRGAECDWQLDDPDMFISRKHCVISGQDGQFTVTDASRGGLFLDGRDKPLGAGVAALLENGTRMRMGDLVMRAELVAVRPVAPARAAAPADHYFQTENSQRAPASAGAAPLPEGFDADDFFTPRPAAPPPPRPESLPQPFEGGPAPFATPEPQRRAAPPLFDDPFTLDPVATPVPQVTSAASLSNFDFGFGDPVVPAAPDTSRLRERAAAPVPVPDDLPPPAAQIAPQPAPPPPPAAASQDSKPSRGRRILPGPRA